MTTLDDQAEAFEQLDRDICLKVRRPILPLTGVCHWCGEETNGVFCGPDCRDAMIAKRDLTDD